MNEPNPTIERNAVQSEASTERPRLKPRPHRSPLAIFLTFAGIALVWLAVMWGILEVMHLDSRPTIVRPVTQAN